MSSRDSIQKTFLVAGALCVVCSVLVSAAAVSLRPIQAEQKALDKQKNILQAAGLYEDGTDVPKVFGERIETRLVDLDTGDYVDPSAVDPALTDAAEYDQKKATKDPELSAVIPGSEDIATLKRREKYGAVYLVKDGAKITGYVLPVRGYGLWSTLWGFLAVDVDGNTVNGLTFFEHGETPGLGGEVDNPGWKAHWPGKELFDADGDVALHVVKGSVDPKGPDAAHQVDGLAGATLTSNGVSRMLEYWFGEHGYRSFLDKIRKGS